MKKRKTELKNKVLSKFSTDSADAYLFQVVIYEQHPLRSLCIGFLLK